MIVCVKDRSCASALSKKAFRRSSAALLCLYAKRRARLTEEASCDVKVGEEGDGDERGKLSGEDFGAGKRGAVS